MSASNPQRLEQGVRLGQLYRYKRERTKTTRSSHWSLCRKVCTWKQRALRLSIWSGCENVQTSFAWSKILRSFLPDAGMQQAECIWCCFWRPLISKHMQALSPPHQISSFQFALCRRAFPDNRLLAWSEVKMSSHNHSMPFNRLMRASC